MKKVLGELPDWSFEVEEVSAGVYEVTGTDKSGHRIQMEGTNYDALLDDACKAAAQLGSQSGR